MKMHLGQRMQEAFCHVSLEPRNGQRDAHSQVDGIEGHAASIHRLQLCPVHHLYPQHPSAVQSGNSRALYMMKGLQRFLLSFSTT